MVIPLSRKVLKSASRKPYKTSQYLSFGVHARTEKDSELSPKSLRMTDAAGIFCFGKMPYICHGYLGADLMRKEGYPRHALVCERHTGAGLSLEEIMAQDLPVPHREMTPVSIEEQVVCFADKFFSKTRLDKEKSVEKARNSLLKYGAAGVERFDGWCRRFL